MNSGRILTTLLTFCSEAMVTFQISHSKLFPVFWIYLFKHCIPEILVPWHLSHGITGLKCLNLLWRKVLYRLYTPLSTKSHIKIRASGKQQKYFCRFEAHRLDKALSFSSVLWQFLCLTRNHERIYMIVFSVVTSDNYWLTTTLAKPALLRLPTSILLSPERLGQLQRLCKALGFLLSSAKSTAKKTPSYFQLWTCSLLHHCAWIIRASWGCVSKEMHYLAIKEEAHTVLND